MAIIKKLILVGTFGWSHAAAYNQPIFIFIFLFLADLSYVGFVPLGNLLDINGDNSKADFGRHFWSVSY
jgi:hypothetical protein